MAGVTPSPWLTSPIKRLIDLVLGVAALAVAAPIMSVCALAVRLTSRGPAFFRQERAGHFGAPIMIVKLRTMRGAVDGDASADDDEKRLTRVGRFLRRFSLDELPQIWNVIAGDMSLIGPRPLPRVYDERFVGNQIQRQLAKPGITGLSQSTFRNGAPWSAKLALDVDYVRLASFTGDLRILVSTVKMVLSGAGVSADGHATMPEFTGGESVAG